MKNILKLLDKVAPQVSARLIYNRISKPQRRKVREFEEQILAKSKAQTIDFKDFTLRGYSWGEVGKPIALLVHGWEGQAGNFGALVPILLEKGYQVIAYDGPAHGKSSYQATNMFEYADFIATRIKAHQPQLIISHSFGTVSTQLALLKNPDFNLQQWIIVTTPFSFK
jgi:pimeloyl-ACP methyl ester carboxylesterase